MKRIAAAVVTMLSLSATATAQTPPAWSSIPYPAMGKGSAACDHLGGQGDVFCFGLRCTAESTPEWFTYQVGGDSIEGEIRVNLVVDGRRHSTLMMKQATTPQGEWSFSAPYDPTRDRSIVDQLKSGTGLYVLVGGASGVQLSLRGSSREIDRTLSMCEVGGNGVASDISQTATPSSYPSAMDPLIRETVEMCINVGGKAELLTGGVKSKDINGDGKPDYLVDLAMLSCGTGLSPFCGAINCEFAVFASHGDAYVSGRYLGVEPRFGNDAVLIPCPDSDRFSEIRMSGGKLKQKYCNQ